MHWKARGWMLVSLLLAMPVVARAAVTAMAQVSGTSAIATTQVADTIYRADGSTATGTVIVSWGAFTTAAGQTVASGSTSATIAAGGGLSVQLAPNAGATPMGSYYTAVYHLDDGSVSREYWVVPVSLGVVSLTMIRSSVLPTSVAMQTVSKSYVDTAIAAAVTGHPLSSSTPYVLKAGDTMTGPLVLPGDPTTATQAADKHYVDVNVGAVTSGLGQKVSTVPAGTQVVAQPVGTQLQVNVLNGAEYASQYVNGTGNNGVANAVASADCASGCEVKVDRSYGATERYRTQSLNSGASSGTHVEDTRQGTRRDSYLNPVNTLLPGNDAGQVLDVVSTRSAASVYQQTGNHEPSGFGMTISHEVLTGGSNQFPNEIESTLPYFKSNYGALSIAGTYNTPGQHVLVPTSIHCYGVGDCLMGSQFLTSSGGFRDNADEGAHPFDLQMQEDPSVFTGTCVGGCTPGSTVVTVSVTTAPGTQGEGRFLIDTNPAKVLTAGVLTGATSGGPGAAVRFSGTAFPVSVFLTTAQAMTSQANNLAPGTVTVPIATSGVATGFATNTAALPSGSGVACVVDVPNGANAHNYEMASYTVVDGTHVQMTLNKVHAAGATVAVGGLCGYGLEQTVDTTSGLRQVFPVIGSYSATGLYYAAGHTGIVGVSGSTSGFLSVSLPVAAIARSGNVVTVTTAGNLPVDVNGLAMTMAGVADASYNGSFAVTTTGPNTLTYNSTGADSSSSGGTVAMLTGGYALYPMAEVLGVFNTATKSVDGQLTLAANTVAWAANDTVEEPHYYQIGVGPDIEYVRQTTPRPALNSQAGIQYEANVGPGITGWMIANAASASSYLGNGGTHTAPFAAYEATGIWRRTFSAQAGDESVFALSCNSHGCGRWNSGYNLFELTSNVGIDTETYNPATSAMGLNLRGSGYSFTPQGFTAGTVNAGTVNATTVNAGTVNAGTIVGSVSAAQLPVFGASGANHAVGAVPDPGATAGTTRYLREDGSWVAPTASGSSSGGAGLTAGATADFNFLQGVGSVLTDGTGNGNSGTLGAGALAPVWSSTGLVFSGQETVALPAALNGTQTFLMAVWINTPPSYGFSNNQFPALITSSNGGTGLNLLYIRSNSASYTGYVAQAYAPTLFVNNSVTTAANTLMSGFHVIGVTLGSSGSSVDHMYVDGVEYAYVTQAASAGQMTAGNLFLGAGRNSLYAGSGFQGTFYRLRTYAAALSAAQVVSSSAALAAEVRARGVVTSPQQQMLGSAELHAIGDSITCGWNGAVCALSTSWSSLLSLTNQPAYTVNNWGIPGVFVEALVGAEPNRVGPQCRTAAGPAVAVVMAGTNDLAAVVGATPLGVFGYLAGEVQELKQAGCRVFVGTMISRTGNDNSGAKTMDAVKDLYDAVMVQQATSAGADGVIDFAANALLGADGASANTTYFLGDHIHPTAAGQQLMANAASNALNYYFGYNGLNPHVVSALPYSMTAADGEVSVAGVSSAGTLTLPDCTGQSGAVYRINNPQATYAVTVQALNGSQLINGLAAGSAVPVPANGTLTLRDVPNAKTVSGCHWEM